MESPHIACNSVEGTPAQRNKSERAGAMLSELLEKVSLFRILHLIDTDLCKQLRQKGCPYCDGPLHQSNYERKPRGGPDKYP